MLTKLVQEAIKANPQFAGLDPVIEKEILHFDILDVLAQEGFLHQLTFIGGTSLRLCYNSNRLSEDLDFTGGCNFVASDFNGLAEKLETHLSNKYGLEVYAREPQHLNKDTSTWKVTLETRPNRPDLPAQKMHLDISAYDSFDSNKLPVINHYGIASPIEGLLIPVESKEELLADKMLAFAYRERRIKPRDVWDIVWLKQQAIEISASLVMKKLAMRSKAKPDFIAKINKHAVWLKEERQVKKDFMQEMLRFLPQEVTSRTLANPDFYPYLVSTIENECRTLERLLTNSTTAGASWQM